MTAFAAVLALALAFSPLKAEEENVRAGNEKLVAGDPKAALERYDAAEKKVGAHPEIEYDRGHAAYRAGRLDEAVERFRKAAEQAPAPLASRALQNAGNALAAKGDEPGALGAYRDALRKDPANEDARYDLEVLLRRKEQPPPPKSGKDQDKEGPAPKQQQGEGQQQGKPPPKPDDQGKEQQKQSPQREGEQQEPQGGEQQQKQPRPAEERQGERAGSLSKQDAERLLDALRAREKKLPQDPRRGRSSGRTDVERDW
ncbi:MAG: tetratricopeptide repeat protein [Anaeromyxobacteraceae bacterium]